MDLNTEELQSLAAINQQMDDGQQPFVMSDGGRMAVCKEAMDELNLRQGQTVTNEIAIGIIPFTLALVRTKMAIENAKSSSPQNEG